MARERFMGEIWTPHESVIFGRLSRTLQMVYGSNYQWFTRRASDQCASGGGLRCDGSVIDPCQFCFNFNSFFCCEIVYVVLVYIYMCVCVYIYIYIYMDTCHYLRKYLFHLRLYCVIHIIKDHSDSERKPATTATWAILF